MEKEKNSSNFLAISILTAAILVAGSLVYATGIFKSSNAGSGQTANIQQAAPSNLNLTPSGNDVILGDANAPVTFIEYGDYQCPFCGKFFSETESQIRENYVKTGKVKMIFRNLAFLGTESTAAAEAADCAKDQGKFWAYHDALYTAKISDAANGEDDGFFNKDLFMKLAQNVGLDTNAFSSCLGSNKYASAVAKEASDAEAVGVNSTPTMFINGQEAKGALPYAQIASIIDQALNSLNKK